MTTRELQSEARRLLKRAASPTINTMAAPLPPKPMAPPKPAMPAQPAMPAKPAVGAGGDARGTMSNIKGFNYRADEANPTDYRGKDEIGGIGYSATRAPYMKTDKQIDLEQGIDPTNRKWQYSFGYAPYAVTKGLSGTVAGTFGNLGFGLGQLGASPLEYMGMVPKGTTEGMGDARVVMQDGTRRGVRQMLHPFSDRSLDMMMSGEMQRQVQQGNLDTAKNMGRLTDIANVASAAAPSAPQKLIGATGYAQGPFNSLGWWSNMGRAIRNPMGAAPVAQTATKATTLAGRAGQIGRNTLGNAVEPFLQGAGDAASRLQMHHELNTGQQSAEDMLPPSVIGMSRKPPLPGDVYDKMTPQQLMESARTAPWTAPTPLTEMQRMLHPNAQQGVGMPQGYSTYLPGSMGADGKVIGKNTRPLSQIQAANGETFYQSGPDVMPTTAREIDAGTELEKLIAQSEQDPGQQLDQLTGGEGNDAIAGGQPPQQPQHPAEVAAAINALPPEQQPAAVKDFVSNAPTRYAHHKMPNATPEQQQAAMQEKATRITEGQPQPEDVEEGVTTLAEEHNVDMSQPNMLTQLFDMWQQMPPPLQYGLAIGIPLALLGMATSFGGNNGLGAMLGLAGIAAPVLGYLGHQQGWFGGQQPQGAPPPQTEPAQPAETATLGGGPAGSYSGIPGTESPPQTRGGAPAGSYAGRPGTEPQQPSPSNDPGAQLEALVSQHPWVDQYKGSGDPNTFDAPDATKLMTDFYWGSVPDAKMEPLIRNLPPDMKSQVRAGVTAQMPYGTKKQQILSWLG